MTAQVLREYQKRGLSQVLDAYRNGARRVLMVLPTGGGKTTVFGSLVADLNRAGRPSLILVHRRELAKQACTRLREFGVDHGLIMAAAPSRPYVPVQVASIQTLVRRKVPRAKLVVCDEAHLSTAPSWLSVLDQYPDARILGVTATPWRLGGKSLSDQYDAVVVVATPRDLRELGFLCDYNGFSYLTPDLDDVGTVGGEYNEAESAAAMSQSLIVDNVVEEWMTHARGLSTVVFAVTVEHSKQLVARFNAAGVKAEHIDGTMPAAQRDAVLARVERGDTEVFSNVGVVVEGLDIPRLKCCVLARPTKSLARAIQMMGRVRRPWVTCLGCGKEDAPKGSRPDQTCKACGSRHLRFHVARIHDHAFVIKSHGLPDSERDYTLTSKVARPPSLTECSECMALYSGTTCPACNKEHEPEPLGERKLNTVADAEQYQFTSDDNTPAPAARPAPESLPPVEIVWGPAVVDREFDGVYLGSTPVQKSWGTQRLHKMRGAKRVYHLPGTSVLDARLTPARVGLTILVKYTGETPLGGTKYRKDFQVRWDDEAARECYCNATPHPPCKVCAP